MAITYTAININYQAHHTVFEYTCVHLLFMQTNRMTISSTICLYQQVLSLVTPKPTEVIRNSAFRFPDVNRSTDFLPRETKYLYYVFV